MPEFAWRFLPEAAWRLTFLPFFSGCDGLTNGLGRTRDKLAKVGGAFPLLEVAARFCNIPAILDALESAATEEKKVKKSEIPRLQTNLNIASSFSPSDEKKTSAKGGDEH